MKPLAALWNWFDSRTGAAQLLHEALYERVPGGARWRYVWGSTLVFAFFTQAVTGLFLWMAYSPSAQTAWESVYYLQYQVQGGWLLRGIHHFMAQAMVVLLALHLMQVVIDGAYRAPREINFWLGLVLMQIVLGLSLTGYLLPWDQKGYWATQVATKLMGVVPVVGADLQKLVVGGTTYGHHTLTRFFALHAGALPAALVFFLVLHMALFRKHGLCAVRPEARPDATFWPDQVLRDAVACLAVLVVVLGLAIWPGLAHGQWGAELGAPADPARSYAAARPEWYFLFLFQFLKYFHGEQAEFLGAVVVPGAVMGVVALMPLVGRWRLGHWFNIGFLAVLGLGVVALTSVAIVEDRRDPNYAAAVAEAEIHAHRAQLLASAPEGIPPQGAVTLLRNDPKTQGPLLYRQYCIGCHRYWPQAVADSADQTHAPGSRAAGLPMRAEADGTEPPFIASNLFRFAHRDWLTGLLDPERIASRDYFGATRHADGEMVHWVQENLANLDEAKRDKLAAVVAALSAEGALPEQRELDEAEAARVAEGREALVKEFACTDCHKFHDAGELGTAPDLTGYGSADWLAGFIGNPQHERYYAHAADRPDGAMPPFMKNPESSEGNVLSQAQLKLLVDWLRHDWYEPAAGPAKAE